MKILVLFLIILSYSCTERRNIKLPKEGNGLPVFLTYGELAPVGYLEEKDSAVAKQFGFEIKRVADCDVTNSLINRVKKNNQKSELIMRQKYGPDWIENFEKQSHLKMSIPDVGK